MTRLLAILITLLAGQLLAADRFCHIPTGQLQMGVDSSRVLVAFDWQLSPAMQSATLEATGRFAGFDTLAKPQEGYVSCRLTDSNNYDQFLDSLKDLAGINLVEPFYTFGNDSPLYVGSTFVVGFDASTSRTTIDSLAQAYQVTLDHEMIGQPNVWLLKNTPNSQRYTVNLANAFHNLPMVDYAEPEFGIRLAPASYKLFDHYSFAQTHLKKVIGQYNTASVWDFHGLQRRNPIVAVLDDGIAPHADLPTERILPYGMSFLYPADVTTPDAWDGHGMACAGIIAASHTEDSIAGISRTTGVFGLNPRAKILPIKVHHGVMDGDTLLGTEGVTPAGLGMAVGYAWTSGAEVISLSGDLGVPCMYTLGISDQLNNAIRIAYTYGRGGKGCPIFVSAGNSAEVEGMQGCVGYPARLPECYSVGAVHLDDSRWPYSQYGSTLHAVAPSGDLRLQGDVWSLDQMDTLGYNNRVRYFGTWCGDERCALPVQWPCGFGSDLSKDMDCHFGGTSATAPVAAGIASLLLAVDSTLTAPMIYRILDSSSIPIGSPRPNPEYGYGRVDAFRAVLSISHGDIDNNGFIADLGDLSALVAYMQRPYTPPFPSIKLADWTCDGVVDLGDLSTLVAYLSGCSTCGPVKPCFRF